MTTNLEFPKELLRTLFFQKEYGQGGVNFRRFRADHAPEIPSLDACERIGLIRRDGEQYLITLLGVAQLDSSATWDFSNTAELIYGILRQSYRAEPGSPVKVSDVAAKIGLDFRQVFQCLALMRDCPSWCDGFSGPGSIDSPETAQIFPAEGILLQPTFESCARKWQSDRSRYPVDTLSPGLSLPLSDTMWGNAVAPHVPEDLAAVLPSDQAELLREVNKAIEQGLLTLASMGLRAVIDMVCLEQIGDLGGFKDKLDGLLAKGTITRSQHPILLTVIDAGNASAHRGFRPDLADIRTVLDVVEHLLDSIYLHPRSAAALAKKTPSRPLKPSKGR